MNAALLVSFSEMPVVGVGIHPFTAKTFHR